MRVVKIGKKNTSAAIIIPKEMCRELDLHIGDHVAVMIGQGGHLVVVKIDLNKRPDLLAASEEGAPEIKYE